MGENNYVFTTSLYSYPKLAGYWMPCEGTKIGVYKMPSRVHQWAMRLAFGWKFEAVTA